MKLNQLLEDSDVLFEGIRLTEAKSYRLWENAGRALKEAALTPDQIQQLFQQIEQGATAAGGNRTMLGKGKDAAAAVNKAWEDLKTKIQDSGPIKNVDAAYDSAVAKIEAGLGGPDNAVNQVIQKYRAFAKAHPIAQGLIYSALIAAAGISGAGLGGAAVLGLLKMTDKLLQGEKFSSAAYQGGKTGAMAYAAGQIGKAMRGDQAQPGAADAAAATPIKGSRGLAAEAERIFREKVANGEVTDYNSYQQGMQDSLQQALQNSGGKMSFQSQEMASHLLKARLDSVVAQSTGGEFVGSGPEKAAQLVKALGGQVDADKIAQQTSAAAQMAKASANSAVKAATNTASSAVDAATNVASNTADAASNLAGAADTASDAVSTITPRLPPGASLSDFSNTAGAVASAPPPGAGMSADYLNKVINGELPRPMISAEKAQAALDWQAQNGGQLQQAADAASSASKGFDPEYLKKVISGEHPRPLISKEKAQELLNQMSGSSETGVPYIDKLNRAAANGVKLREDQIRRLFRIIDGLPVNEGMWDTIKGAAGNALGAVANKAATVGKNLTTKITADKLMSAWKSADSPTDSAEVKAFLQKQGVDAAIIDPAMKAVGVVDTPAPATDPATAPAGATPGAAAKAGKVGVPAGKAAVDQAVNAIKSVRSDRRQQVVQYAQTKFGAVKEDKFHSRFLGMDI
jgi:hypothetical protein